MFKKIIDFKMSTAYGEAIEIIHNAQMFDELNIIKTTSFCTNDEW